MDSVSSREIFVRHSVSVILLCLFAISLSGCAERIALGRGQFSGQVEVSGRVVTGAGALSAGRLAVFRVSLACAPDINGINRVPGAVAMLDKDGRFRIELSPDIYFFGAVEVTGAPYGGELLKSEKFYLSHNRMGGIRRYDLTSVMRIDLGDVVMEASDRSAAGDQMFTIRGRVLNDKGEPVKDAVVAAKNTFDDLRPQFISLPTDSGGKYLLKVTPGSYHLVARMKETSFGRPKTNELLGVYGENRQVGVKGRFRNVYGPQSVVTGGMGETLTGSDIVMFPVPDPEAIKLEKQKL